MSWKSDIHDVYIERELNPAINIVSHMNYWLKGHYKKRANESQQNKDLKYILLTLSWPTNEQLKI